ncbi:hypothetical protein MPDQ_005234 [Monascus purpureus]|uniref:Uncharacterized protein n=1 Tax=Monascus purpureus TaxID=5098 RepID=A0A507R0U9_MONPU|nr:hypothetical protein MPDQ_005234 [Monascus purpureus]
MSHLSPEGHRYPMGSGSYNRDGSMYDDRSRSRSRSRSAADRRHGSPGGIRSSLHGSNDLLTTVSALKDLLRTEDATIPGTEILDDASEVETEMTIVGGRRSLLRSTDEEDLRTEIAIARAIARRHMIAAAAVAVAASGEVETMARKAERL